MHSTQLAPAGKALELEEKQDGHWLRAKVVEPTAVKLVEEGVYSAFSVGIGQPRIAPDPMAKRGRIVDGRIIEVSLVDHPANPNCKFMVAKAADDGSAEYVGEAVVGELQQMSLVNEPQVEKKADEQSSEVKPAEKAEQPDRLKALHDALCWAYEWPADGFSFAQQLMAAKRVLVEAMQGYLGTPDVSAQELLVLAEAHKALVESTEPVTEDLLLAARAELRKDFTDLYPTTTLSFQGAGTPTPGAYRRGLITAGHQRYHRPGSNDDLTQSARIPSATHPVSPTDYQRGYISAGHQNTLSAQKLLMQIHDALQAVRPSLCPLEAPKHIEDGIINNGYAGTQGQNTTNTLHPVLDGGANRTSDARHGAVAPAVSTSATGMGDLGNMSISTQDSTPRPVDPVTPAAPTWDKSALPDLIKAHVATEIEQVKAVLESTYKAQIDSLKAEVENLAAQPSPSAEPFRGAPVMERPSQVAEVQKRATDDQRQRRAFLMRESIYAADPAWRLRAQELLAQMDQPA